jgi:hypothetical protein
MLQISKLTFEKDDAAELWQTDYQNIRKEHSRWTKNNNHIAGRREETKKMMNSKKGITFWELICILSMTLFASVV